MFFCRIKNALRGVAALALSFLALAGVWGMGVSRFPHIEGDRQYYLDSPSSQAKIADGLSPFDFARVEGESVSLSLNEGEALALIKSLSGEVLFIEEAAGVRSYYCYSPTLFGGIKIGEYFVNLHVAVEGERCVVGSPIIFGSF